MADGRFDMAGFHAAMDAERIRRGLTWAAVTAEINGQFAGMAAARFMSASTVSSMGRKAMAEGDGVLQAMKWLGRTPESFTPGREHAGEPLPVTPTDRILRFDCPAIHTALDARRQARGLTWAQAAAEVGLPSGFLTGMARSSRTAFPAIMAIAAWLDTPIARLTRVSAA